MDEQTANAWIQASNSVNQAAGVIAQNNLNYNTRLWNEKMINQQRDWAISDRDYANAYNSPLSVMDRLKKAGINPMYGVTNGNVITASSPTRDVSGVGAWHPQVPEMPQSKDMTSYIGLQMMQAQLENTKAQNANINADTELKLRNAQYTDTKNTGGFLDNKLKDLLMSNSVGMAIARYANLESDLKTKDYLQTNLFERNNYLATQNEFLHDENARRDAMVEGTLQEKAEHVLLMMSQRALADEKAATEPYQREMYRQKYEQVQQWINNLRKDGQLKDWMLQYNRQKLDPGTEKTIDVVMGILGLISKNGGYK